MKKFARMMGAGAITAALALVAPMAAPAGAAVTGAGPVNGTVSLRPGIIGTTGTSQSYTFNSIVLNGTFADGANAFAGNITVNGVAGASNPNTESITSGQGYVGTFPVNGTGVGTLSGTCRGYDHVDSHGNPDHGSAFTAGGYDRVGSIVLVKLRCAVSINGAAPATQNVYVAAQFTPTTGDGVVSPITEANFAGAYETGADLF